MKINPIQQIFLVGLLALTSCQLDDSRQPEVECAGGQRETTLVYNANASGHRIQPAIGVTIETRRAFSPDFFVGDLYVQPQAAVFTGGENWQILDGPLQPGEWVGGTHISDLYQFSIYTRDGKGFAKLRYMEAGGHMIRTEEFCLNSKLELFSRPARERK